jgi:hypothetical protein
MPVAIGTREPGGEGGCTQVLQRSRQMTMVGLTRDQRALIADKLGDVGNLAAAGLLFAQFVSDRPFSISIALAGFAVWLTVMIIAVRVRGSRQ